MNKFDVIVVGGGIAGSAASVSAVREGQKVLLIEKAILYASKMLEGTGALMMETGKHLNSTETDNIERMKFKVVEKQDN